jgi:excisionase family DNA binding protein
MGLNVEGSEEGATMMRLLNKKEAAARLAVSVRTLDRMRSTGEISAVKVRGAVRFDPAAIDRYIMRHTVSRG